MRPHLINSPFTPVVTQLCEWDEQQCESNFSRTKPIPTSAFEVLVSVQLALPVARKPSCLDEKLLLWSCGCACVALNLRDKLPLVRDFPLCRSVARWDAASEGVLDELLKTFKTRKQPYSFSTADWPQEVACSNGKLNDQGPVSSSGKD